MALIDKASLLMVPSTYEAGTLYNVLPSGNRAPDSTDQNSGYDQTRADFTFDRGSNAAATRIGSDGLIKKYRENYFKNSNAFNTSPWSGSATWTSGQADKDGGTSAWTFAKSGASNSDYYNDTTINGVQTFSIYVKKQTGVGIKPYFFGSVNGYATINLEDGSKYTASSAIIDYKAEAYNDNWWRVSVTINASSGNWYIYVTDGTDTQTTTPITIQNAQLESGLVSTDYLDSGATTAKAGVLIDLPRINYDANGENGSLLLEPSRQQLFQYSEYYGASFWTKTAISAAQNVSETKSPEGLYNASKLTPDTTNNSNHALRGATITIGTTYTVSIFAKAAGYDYLIIRGLGLGGSGGARFNIANGTKEGLSGYSSYDIEDYGNGWYLCSATGTALTSDEVYFNVSNTATHQSYVGDGTSGIYVWGAQLEAGSYVSSYIPNMGESGGVTRAADSCSVTGVSDVIGQSEGTLFAQVGEFPKEYNGRILGISDGTSSNYVIIIKNAANTDFAVYATNGGTAQATYLGTGSLNDNSKIAVGYANNDYVVYVNGTQVHTDTSASVPTCDDVWIGQRENGSVTYIAGGSLKQAILFNERLSNAELATLTTL